MSQPRSPYTKLTLPPLPAENDEPSQLTPNKFHREQPALVSPNKALNRVGSNPLLQPLFDDPQHNGPQVNSPSPFMNQPGFAETHQNPLKSQSHRQMPISAVEYVNGLQGYNEASVPQNTGLIKASQLTFNDSYAHMPRRSEAGSARMGSPRGSINRSDPYDESGVYRPVSYTQAPQTAQGGQTIEHQYTITSGNTSNTSSFRVLPLQSDASGIRNQRRMSRSNINRNSRSQSRDPSKKHPSFEPPVCILDGEALEQNPVVVQKAGDLNSHHVIFFDRKQSSGSLSINNSGGLSGIDTRQRRSETTVDSRALGMAPGTNNPSPQSSRPPVQTIQFVRPPVAAPQNFSVAPPPAPSPRSYQADHQTSSPRSTTQVITNTTNIYPPRTIQITEKDNGPKLHEAFSRNPLIITGNVSRAIETYVVSQKPSTVKFEPQSPRQEQPTIKSYLLPPPQHLDPNRLRDSTIVTEEMMNEKKTDGNLQKNPIHVVDNRNSHNSEGSDRNQGSLQALQIFNSAIELQASLAFATMVKPSSPNRDFLNETKNTIDRDSLKNRFSTEPSTTGTTALYQGNTTLNSDTKPRALSPPPRLFADDFRKTSPQTVQSERRVQIISQTQPFPVVQDAPRTPTFQPAHPLRILTNITPVTHTIQAPITSPPATYQPSTSIPSRVVMNQPTPISYQPVQRPPSLEISILPSLTLPPRDSLLRTKLNEVILENSRLRTDLNKEREKMGQVQNQVDRLSTIETDFYLLLNHVTHYEKQAEAAPQKVAAPISPVLLELLDLNGLVSKEKEKLEEYVREKEKVEGIIKGLKMKLKDQVSKYAVNSSGVTGENKSELESKKDTGRVFMQSGDVKTISKQVQSNHAANPTVFVNSGFSEPQKNRQNSNETVQKSFSQAPEYQPHDYNPLMMYGSMLSEHDPEHPSRIKLDYSASKVEDANHSNAKPVINLYSSNYQQDQSQIDFTPKIGSKASPNFQDGAFGNQKPQGYLNAFESQIDSGNHDYQVVMSNNQSHLSSSQRNHSKGNTQNNLDASVNPLAISKSIISNQDNTPRIPDEYHNGPFQITLEKSNRIDQSSIGGAKKIVSRFGTIVPSSQEIEIMKLKEMLEALAKENAKLQEQVESNSKCNSKRDMEPTKDFGIKVQMASEHEKLEEPQVKQPMTIKLPKCESFGDYSSSGGGVQRSAEFCEVHGHDTNAAPKNTVTNLVPPEENNLSPNYKNFDFFGNRPSVVRGTQFGFINIHDAENQKPKLEKIESVIASPDNHSKFDFTSIYSFQPSAEMVSILNHETIKGQDSKPCESIAFPNAHQETGVHHSIIHHLQMAVKPVPQEEVSPPQAPVQGKPQLFQTIKAVEAINRLKNAKKIRQLSGHQPDEEEEELPIRHGGTQPVTPPSNRIQEEEPQKEGSTSHDPKSDLTEVKRMIEDLSNKIHGGDSSHRSVDKSLKDLKIRVTAAFKEDCFGDEDDDAQSGFVSKGASLGDISSVEELKAKYIKMIRDKAEMGKRLKEEQEKSLKYREMVVAKLKAIETMKDVYQRQIERMVDYEEELEEFD